jgi:hypothetical protein
MGIKLKNFVVPPNPKDAIAKTNPISAYVQADKHGGDPMKAVLDPQQLILKSGPRSSAERIEADAQDKADFDKERKKRRGYAKGGQVKKIGVGGYYRKRS